MVAGLAISISHRQTQRGRMASLLLDDRSGRIEATLFSEAYEEYRELLSGDRVLVVVGSLNHDEYRGGLGIRVEQVMAFEQARALHASCLRLTLDWRRLQQLALSADDFAAELAQTLFPYRGGNCELRLYYQRRDAKAVLRFGAPWKVNPTDELLRRLERLLGSDGVEVMYMAAPPQQASMQAAST